MFAFAPEQSCQGASVNGLSNRTFAQSSFSRCRRCARSAFLDFVLMWKTIEHLQFFPNWVKRPCENAFIWRIENFGAPFRSPFSHVLRLRSSVLLAANTVNYFEAMLHRQLHSLHFGWRNLYHNDRKSFWPVGSAWNRILKIEIFSLTWKLLATLNGTICIFKIGCSVWLTNGSFMAYYGWPFFTNNWLLRH